MNDNVVSFKKDSTREMLKKVLQAYDDGRIQSVVVVGQGSIENEAGETQRVVMPLVSEETGMSELTFASTLLSGYAQSMIQYVLSHGTYKDA